MTEVFERRYRAEVDPWGTSSKAYESAKRERTLAACGEGPFGAVCDLGAGLGLLGVALAPRCARLVALDGAPTAVAAARERLAPFPWAQARVGVLPADLPQDGPFDLVVASEILYYLDDPALDAVRAWLPRALTPGGRVVAVHWTGAAPDLRRDADAVGAALAATPGLRARTTERADGYRLDVVERAR